MMWNKALVKLFILRMMYVITILLVQTDVLTADELVPHFDRGIHFILQAESPGDEIEPDDDYTRTRTIVCPSVAIVPLILTLIPNQYIIPRKSHTPKPLNCITSHNSHQADLCIFRI